MISEAVRERMDGLIRTNDRMHFNASIRNIISNFREEGFEDAEINMYFEQEIETAFEKKV